MRWRSARGVAGRQLLAAGLDPRLEAVEVLAHAGPKRMLGVLDLLKVVAVGIRERAR
jgi:hypothetical protein